MGSRGNAQESRRRRLWPFRCCAASWASLAASLPPSRHTWESRWRFLEVGASGLPGSFRETPVRRPDSPQLRTRGVKESGSQLVLRAMLAPIPVEVGR